MGSRHPTLKIALTAALAMLAFAANSLLCRLALDSGAIDATSFTALRLIAGALLLQLVSVTTGGRGSDHRDGFAGLALFVYALSFSFAYISLTAATGALILFAAVQLTMVSAGLLVGEHLTWRSAAGMALAIGGLIYLVAPGLAAPSPLGAGLMATAGVAWGIYSLRGRGARDPLRSTARNFLYTVPMALAALAVASTAAPPHWSVNGVVLAILSGAIASGLGYVMWYAALRGLTAVHAATIQLSVPVLAAFGAVVLLSETLSRQLVLSSLAIIGGIALVIHPPRHLPRG